MEGLRKTIDWYYSDKDRGQVREILDRIFAESTLAPACVIP